MNTAPVVYRESPSSVISPVVPLNFVYPGLSLRQLFSIIWANKLRSILIMVLVLTIAVLVIMRLPKTYTATATLMVNYEVSDPLNARQLPIGQVRSYIATQIELMRTQEVLLTVVDRLNLTADEDYVKGYSTGDSSLQDRLIEKLQTWLSVFDLSEQPQPDSQSTASQVNTFDGGTLREWVTVKLRKNLHIYPSQLGSQLIYVSYSADNATEAAQIANTIVDVYKEEDRRRSTGPPSERLKRYEQQLSELKEKVNQAQEQVIAFNRENDLIDGGNNANVDTALLSALEGRLLEAQYQRRQALSRAQGDQSVSDKALASPEVQDLRSQLASQELQLAHLESLYTPQHPDILNLRSEIIATRLSLAAAVQRYADNASAELIAAEGSEKRLQQAVAEQRAKVLAVNQLHDQATQYQLALDSAQTVYKRALEDYDQITFDSSGQNTNISVTSPARPPVKPNKAKLKMLLLAAVIAGILGVGIPLGWELFNRRIRCRDDLERDHGIQVLGEFKKVPRRARRVKAAFRSRRAAY